MWKTWASFYKADVNRPYCDEKIICITPGLADDKPRFVFRTNEIKVARFNNEVVLTVNGFENWYYIIYFRNRARGTNFMDNLTGSGSSRRLVAALDIPSDLQAYLSRSRN